MADERLAFDIFARDDASGTFRKVANAADRTGDALRRASKSSDVLSESTRRLKLAHDNEADALGKVNVAEQRLADIRGNSKAKLSQIKAAEEALAKARRASARASADVIAQESKINEEREKDFRKSGEDSGKAFGSGLKKWLTGSGADLGKEGGTVFGSGFLGALKTPVLGPALVATLGAAVAVAAPAAGAIAAGGIVAGFGVGLGALGAVFAAKSVVVKNAWNRTLSSMAADMTIISKPFEKTLLNMAAVAKRTFATFKPELAAAFQSLAPALSEFGDQLGKAFAKLAPAVQPLSRAFEDVLKSLGPAMQSALGKVSDGLIKLAESVQKNPTALADTVKGLGDLTNSLFGFLTTLNDLNGRIESMTGGVSAVDGVFGVLKGTVMLLKGPFLGLEGAFKSINGLMGGTKSSAQGLNSEVQISTDTMKLWTQGLTAAQAAAAGTGAALDPLPKKVESLAVKFDRQWQATQRANEALTRQSNLLLTLSGSEIAFQAALDAATASIKENGRTHDINTEKGRRNQQALNDVASAANSQTIAMRNAGDGNVSAAKHAEGARANFVKLAQQMGYTKPKAEEMARSMISIPNVSRTAKLNANIKDLESKLSTAKGKLADKNLTKERKAQLNADIRKLEQALARARAALGGVPRSKTVTITTKYITERIARNVSGASGGHVPAEPRAAGGPVKAGQPYWVGEKGPEPFIPDQNGVILPNSAVKKTGSTPVMGGGATTVVLKVESGGSRMDDFIAELIRKYVRVNGGDVQAVFGRG
jgi:hypothetical protein